MEEKNKIIQSLLFIVILLFLADIGERIFGVPKGELKIILQKLFTLAMSILLAGAMLLYLPKKAIRIVVLLILFYILVQTIK